MKNKKYMLFGFLSAATALSLSFSSTLYAKSEPDTKKSTETTRLEALAKFTKVISAVEKYNVDKLTIEDLIDKSLEGMLSNIDAHSAYLNQKRFESLQIQTKGEFGGLGITVGMKDGALTVISPIEGTPADKAGLKSGDIILKVDDKSTLNMTIDEAVKIMRGKPKTPIDLTIVRKGESKPLHIHIIRDIIKVQSVYTKDIGKSTLYIRVTSFDQKVVEGVKEAIEKNINSADKPKKSIILDLRNNPGGLLDQAVGLVNLFVSEGNIVSQKGRDASQNTSYDANSRTTITDVPMVVLVNGGSASASEIVSGALQDHKRAVIIGEKTFGKGSVQIILPVTNEEAIKLTIARYYLPSGRTIQAVGVEPDLIVEAGKVPHYENEFSLKEADLKKHLQSELKKVDGEEKSSDKEKSDKKDDKIITTKQINNDIQLKEALDVVKALQIIKGK